MTRRQFVAATGAAGLASLAGCAAGPSRDQDATDAATETTSRGQRAQLPTTAPPQVVNVDEQDGEVTLSSTPAVHHAHPGETMGGPVTLPQV